MDEARVKALELAALASSGQEYIYAPSVLDMAKKFEEYLKGN